MASWGTHRSSNDLEKTHGCSSCLLTTRPATVPSNSHYFSPLINRNKMLVPQTLVCFSPPPSSWTLSFTHPSVQPLLRISWTQGKIFTDLLSDDHPAFPCHFPALGPVYSSLQKNTPFHPNSWDSCRAWGHSTLLTETVSPSLWKSFSNKVSPR